MTVVPGHDMSIDWTVLKEVKKLAFKMRDAGCSDQIIFWNGQNYQITHECRRGQVLANGNEIVANVRAK